MDPSPRDPGSGRSPVFQPRRAQERRRWGSVLLLALPGLALLLVGEAGAQCRNPGQTCGVLGGSCCSGSSCIVGICVSNCAGEGGVCVTSSNCCGSRVCALGFCQTPRALGQACGPGFPCQSGLVCDPFSGFVCIDDDAGLGEACGPLVHCVDGLVCDPLSGFVCIDDTAGPGQACGPLVHCRAGLTCDPFSGFVCIGNAGLGESCGLFVVCEEGLVCDPLAGFTCVEERATVGEPCGPLVPCNPGLACDPLRGFVCVDQSVSEGEACGPLVQCEAGLFCDPLAGFRCVTAAGVDEPCGPGVPCQGDLQCTLALRCSHEPSLAGETCDVTAPCDDGLFCQPGLPQRCHPRRKPGEGCSAVNPCVEGASCEICLVNGCNAPLQCFPNANAGAITENQCRVLYSPGLREAALDANMTMTVSAGDSAAAVLGESQAFGVVYGQDGRYGCFTTLCGGINADVSIEAFAAAGFYTGFDAVGGSSFANFQEAQLPGNVLNFSTSQVFAREPGQVLPLPELIGTEDAFAVGVGPDILPFSAGSFLCETVLDTVIDPEMSGLASLAIASSTPTNASLPFGLEGWSCLDGGSCAWVEDDAAGSETSGSAEVSGGRLVSSCVSVMPDQPYELGAWLKSLGSGEGALQAVFHAGTSCGGASVGTELLGTSPADETWREFVRLVHTPAGAQSVTFELVADASGSSRIDLLRVPEAPGWLALGLALLTASGLARVRRRGSAS